MASVFISKKLKPHRGRDESFVDQKAKKLKPQNGRDESFIDQNEEAESKKRKKFNPSNEKAIQVTLTELPQKFDLSSFPHQSCKVLEPSNNITHRRDQAMGFHFPEEIFCEILSRLPVRSLHRFKCVSKGWKALISDPYFTMKHFNRTKSDQNSQKFLVSSISYDRVDTSIYSSSLSSVELVENEVKLDFPFKPQCCRILCTCNGLVLLFCRDVRSNGHLLLWNPSTRESISLPRPRLDLCRCICGMSYDTSSDDYKILMVTSDAVQRPEVSNEILELKSGSWRISEYPTEIRRVLENLPCDINPLAFVHGTFHWVGWIGYYTLISFDISNEVYGKIPLLERMCWYEIEEGMDIILREYDVSVLGGMLCFYSTWFNGVEGTFDLWMMKEYGVKESWTALYRIQNTSLLIARPRYRYADGELLLHYKLREHGHAVTLYWITRGILGSLPPEDTNKQEIIYTESLISPKLLTPVFA